MSDKPVTHKGRNLIDDMMDGGLALLSIIYFVIASQTGFELDDQTLALIATAGATVRVTLRKVLMRLYGEKLGVSTPATDAPTLP